MIEVWSGTRAAMVPATIECDSASMSEFKPQELDRKWQRKWTESSAFEVVTDPSRPKFYCLEMFAYPSGHAHVGHVRNYIIGDVMARMKRMRGCNDEEICNGAFTKQQP